MRRLAVDWRPVAAIGALLLVTFGLIAVWTIQGWSMRGDFVRALREGRIPPAHRDLQGKRWSEEELDSVEVMAVPDASVTERALTRELFTRGRDVVSSQQYAYQATIRDSATGIIHVFGYRRHDPRQWRWAGMHPASRHVHMQRLTAEQRQMKAATK